MQKRSKPSPPPLAVPPPGAIGLPFMSKGTPWYGYVALNAITTLLPAVVTYVARANR